MAKKNENKSFVLRVDAATMDALERWADDEFRSINGQLQWIIADALRRSGRLKKAKNESQDKAADEFRQGGEVKLRKRGERRGEAEKHEHKGDRAHHARHGQFAYVVSLHKKSLLKQKFPEAKQVMASGNFLFRRMPIRR